MSTAVRVTPEPSTPSSPIVMVKLLPLDWTRVKRKRTVTRPEVEVEGDVEGDEDEDCCDDPATCLGRQRQVATITSSSPSSLPIRGHAVFLLHDTNPSLLQGYFIPRGSNKPWGLLAVQEEIDECLACVDGGYRRISLTIYPAAKQQQRRQRRLLATKKSSSHKIQGIDWTGGDMMRLEKQEQLQMETDRLWTGNSAIPYLEQ
jgi:hypothetical protein